VTVERGRVVAVCASTECERGVRKATVASARVTRHGIPGDKHFAEWDTKAGPPVANDRPITVVAREAVVAACGALGIEPLSDGALGENLLVEGLGDLSDLRPGDGLRVGGVGRPAVLLRVSKQNAPCRNLKVWHERMPEALKGRRGVICTVSVEGEVRPGDDVDVVRQWGEGPVPKSSR
jgi:MOSC domain-containing protein YiiM